MLLARITVTLYGVIMHASSRCCHWLLALIAQVNCGANQHHVDTAFPKGSLNEEACVKYPLGCEMPAMVWTLQLACMV
jgi:hypothetical protein